MITWWFSLISIISWMIHGVGKGNAIFKSANICRLALQWINSVNFYNFVLFFVQFATLIKQILVTWKKVANLSGKFAAKITLYLGSIVDLILKSLAKRNDLLENLATFQRNPIFFFNIFIYVPMKNLIGFCEAQLKSANQK